MFENFGLSIKNTQTLFRLFYLLSNSSCLLMPEKIPSSDFIWEMLRNIRCLFSIMEKNCFVDSDANEEKATSQMNLNK